MDRYPAVYLIKSLPVNSSSFQYIKYELLKNISTNFRYNWKKHISILISAPVRKGHPVLTVVKFILHNQRNHFHFHHRCRIYTTRPGQGLGSNERKVSQTRENKTRADNTGDQKMPFGIPAAIRRSLSAWRRFRELDADMSKKIKEEEESARMLLLVRYASVQNKTKQNKTKRSFE